MMNGWQQFVRDHWISGGIATSLLWFLASRGSNKHAMFWQSIAVFILLAVCGWSAFEGLWIGLAFGVMVLLIEALLMKRSYMHRAQTDV